MPLRREQDIMTLQRSTVGQKLEYTATLWPDDEITEDRTQHEPLTL